MVVDEVPGLASRLVLAVGRRVGLLQGGDANALGIVFVADAGPRGGRAGGELLGEDLA